MIENDPVQDWMSHRCGHNFPISECPHHYCDARDLLAACLELCRAQRLYEFNACEPDMMPGNGFYATKFMEPVKLARAVLERLGTPSRSLGDPLA